MAPGSWRLVHETTYGVDDDLTAAIVYAIADARGVDPATLRPNLYDAVDVSALESLFDLSDSGRYPAVRGAVEFPYAGCHVVVRSDGLIYVYEPASA